MDKESIFELQKIDCNCSDCFFMRRDIAAYEKSLALHHAWQLDYFNSILENLKKKAADWLTRGEKSKSDQVHKEISKMKFQFNRNEASINYGHCEKFNKSVSFIPNTCQIETQNCFQHRRSQFKFITK